MLENSRMTSRQSPTKCFVYITLPGMTEPVPAARFELISVPDTRPTE